MISNVVEPGSPVELGPIVFSEEAIQRAVSRIAGQLTVAFDGQPILMVAVLKGALLFSADLMRALGEYPVTIDFMAVVCSFPISPSTEP